MAEIGIEKEPGAARLVLTLVVAGALSGLVLVGVFLGTEPRILRNQYEALQAAVFRVLPGTTSSALLVVRGGRLERYEGPEGVLPKEPVVVAGYDAEGRFVGYAVPGTGPGFMDAIGLLYGFDPARRTIVGMEVLESRETPGLGDKIITDDAFLANFAALAVDPEIVAVKRGTKSAPNEVDSITGATISSEAVVKILNESRKRWDSLLVPAGETASKERAGGEEGR